MLEHTTIVVSYESSGLMKKRADDWVATLPDGSRWVGWHRILDAISERGWELVTAVADRWGGATLLERNVYLYRLFLKPRREEGS